MVTVKESLQVVWCESCHWCASYFTTDNRFISRSPVWGTNKLESLPIPVSEQYRLDSDQSVALVLDSSTKVEWDFTRSSLGKDDAQITIFQSFQTQTNLDCFGTIVLILTHVVNNHNVYAFKLAQLIP